MKFFALLLTSVAFLTMSSATEEKQKSIVLETLSGEHLGFTFFHPSFEENSGDCIFMVLPTNSELFESKEGKFFTRLKDMGEFKWMRKEGIVTISMESDNYLLILHGGRVIDPKNNEVVASLKVTKDKKN